MTQTTGRSPPHAPEAEDDELDVFGLTHPR